MRSGFQSKVSSHFPSGRALPVSTVHLPSPFFPPRIVKRLHGHIQSHLAPVFEAIHHRPGRTGDLDRYPADDVLLNPGG